jgi:hypothetical protein
VALHSIMPARHAFTIRELISVIGVLVILGSLAYVLVPGSRRESQRVKDGQHIRGLHQAFVTCFQSNADEYPLPSRLDRANYVSTLPANEKNTTANIYSILVFNGTIKPEILISSTETNRHLAVYARYQYDQPSRAAVPSQATWDPKLSAVLDGTVPGNVSYAHLQPAGERKKRWGNTFNSSEVVVSNRGPQIASVVANLDSSVSPTFVLPSSNTLRFYRRDGSWTGWMAFNDNHTEFRLRQLAPGRPYGAATEFAIPQYQNNTGKKVPDTFCHDEADDPKSGNDFLGIFLKAGETPADFKAAWD